MGLGGGRSIQLSYTRVSCTSHSVTDVYLAPRCLLLGVIRPHFAPPVQRPCNGSAVHRYAASGPGSAVWRRSDKCSWSTRPRGRSGRGRPAGSIPIRAAANRAPGVSRETSDRRCWTCESPCSMLSLGSRSSRRIRFRRRSTLVWRLSTGRTLAGRIAKRADGASLYLDRDTFKTVVVRLAIVPVSPNPRLGSSSQSFFAVPNAPLPVAPLVVCVGMRAHPMVHLASDVVAPNRDAARRLVTQLESYAGWLGGTRTLPAYGRARGGSCGRLPTATIQEPPVASFKRISIG